MLVYSFLYGMFFSFFLGLNYKLLYNNKKSLKIIFTSLFLLINIILYFLLLRRINEGILHPYSFIAIILGFTLEYYVRYLVANHKKKWYNSNRGGR